MNRSHFLIKNSLYNFFGNAWILILSFITTPYIVFKLGPDAYGILAIVTTVIGYFGFLSLGLGTAIVKYVSEYNAKKDFRSINKILGTSLIVYCIMGAIGGLIIALLTSLLVSKILKIPDGLINVAYSAFYISSVGFFVNMPLNIFYSIPMAFQRFDVVNKMNIFVGTLQTILTVLLLIMRYTLKEIVVMNVILSIFSIFLFLIINKKLWPAISFKLVFDFEFFQKLLKFGGFISISRLTITIANNLDKFVIGMFLPISYLTYYTVPKNIAQKLLFIPSNIVSVILPATSELSSIGDRQSLRELYLRSNKYIAMIVIPVTFLLAIFSKELLTYWMGAEFARIGTFSLQILSISVLFGAIGWTSVAFAQALNRPDISALIQFLQAIANILFCFMLIPRMGINGAAIAFLINYAILNPLMIYFTTKLDINTSIGELVKKSFIKPGVLGILLVILGVIIRPFVIGLFSLIAICLLLCFFFMSLSYLFILDKRDKEIVLSYISSNKIFEWLKNLHSKVKNTRT